MRRQLALTLPALVALCPQEGAVRQAPATVEDRTDATAILSELRRIHAPEGIEVLERVDLGGVPQWISIRGQDRANPVLLFLHGGPGDPGIGISWAYQRPWEDYFTVVNWDQRAGGKNAPTADREALFETMTLNRMVRDAEELVDYLRERLEKDRIVVLGHSWGSVLGVHLARRRPEWLHAYVGVGQASSMPEIERALLEATLERARAAGDSEAVRELREVERFPPETDGDATGDQAVVRKWARIHDGGWYGKDDWSAYFSLPLLSPAYTAEEATAARDGAAWVAWRLVTEGLFDYDLRDAGTEFEVPIVLIMGRLDLHTPYETARAYFDELDASHKRFVTFERSAHLPFLEQPGRFLVALLEHVLPLTEGAAAGR